MAFRAAAIVLYCALAPAQDPAFTPRRFTVPAGERIAGAALKGRRLITWGDRLLEWTLDGGLVRVLVPKADAESSGCFLDVNGDGLDDLVLVENGRLVWRAAPSWKPLLIASEIETPDLLPVVLFGRRGVLLVQKYAQVRFYEVPVKAGEPWPVRDIYSFYTPSREAGLLMSDVDADGRPDILCGNYWIRSPEEFELPWRLFAINTYNETPASATVRLAMADARLVVSQGEIPDARLALFEKPADPKQQWMERRLEGDLRLEKPRALATGDFDGDGRADIVMGENGGANSRLLLFASASGFIPREIGRGGPMHTAFAVDGGVLTVGPASITFWAHREAGLRPATAAFLPPPILQNRTVSPTPATGHACVAPKGRTGSDGVTCRQRRVPVGAGHARPTVVRRLPCRNSDSQNGPGPGNS